jgi:hypothetical protein
MSVIEQALIITVILIIEYLVLIWQSLTLARLHQSKAYWLHAAGWFILGAVRVFRFVRTPATLTSLRDRGWTPPSTFTFEEYASTFLVMFALLLFAIGYEKRRRSQRSIGIDVM